jgi:hypothetical protein
MSDTLSFVEIDSQDVELLPARTVMSAFHMGGGGEGYNPVAGAGGDAATTQNTLVNLLGIVSGGSKGGGALGA